MNGDAFLLAFLSASLVRPLLLAGAAFLVLRLFRVEHPASRHAVWMVAFVGMAVLPFANVFAPPVPIAALPEGALSRIEPEWRHRIDLPSVPSGDLIDVSGASGSQADASGGPALSPDKAIAIVTPPPSPPLATPGRTFYIDWRRIDWRPAVLGFYLLGVFAAAAYRVLGWGLMRRLVARALPPRKSITSRKRLFHSDDIATPVAVGAWRPRVLIPAEWYRWDALARRAAIAHEFEHIRRRDAWTLGVARWVTCVYWFHPLFWKVSGRMAELAEMACDVKAVERLGDADRYSKILLEFASAVGRRGHRAGLPGLAVVGTSRIDRRIDQIFALSSRPLRRLPRPVLALLLLGVPVLACAATVRVTELASKPLAGLTSAVAERLQGLPAAGPLLNAIASLRGAEPLLLPSEALPFPQGLSADDVKTFIDSRCVICHGGDRRLWPDLNLANFDPSKVREDAKRAEHVAQRIRNGFEFRNTAAGAPPWDRAEAQRVAQWIEDELDRSARPYMPPPGSKRLSRVEYANALKELFGLEIKPAFIIPEDTRYDGFVSNLMKWETAGMSEKAFGAAAESVARAARSFEGRQRFLLCSPATPAEAVPCAERIVRSLATRAFRRPLSENEFEDLMSPFRSRPTDEQQLYYFEASLFGIVKNILADPRFYIRTEAEPLSDFPNQTYRISDYELASRLSFFLWRSIPDDRLLDLAGRGLLHTPEVLEQETRRMLRDPRAAALTTSFASDWLALDGLKRVGPLPGYPDFDEALVRAMREEAELFFASFVDEDRNIAQLLNAPDTFLNERLARHYGVPNVTGPEFRRVTLDGAFDVRRGLLGKAAVLTVTSFATRTSLTQRGQWVLRTMFNAGAPPPPPNEEPLPPLGLDPAMRPAMKESLEPYKVCVPCHEVSDPAGIALENFDRAGKWRDTAGGKPLDVAAVLLDGTKIDGVRGLREALVERSDLFVRTFTGKLFGYALGRGGDLRDMPAVRTITRNAAREGNRFSSIILGIVKSDAFQMNMK